MSVPIRLIESKPTLLPPDPPFQAYDTYHPKLKPKQKYNVFKEDFLSGKSMKSTNKLNLMNNIEVIPMKTIPKQNESCSQSKSRVHIHRMPPIPIYSNINIKPNQTLSKYRETSSSIKIPSLTNQKRTSSSIKPAFFDTNTKDDQPRSLATFSFEAPSILKATKLKLPKIKAKSWVIFDETNNTMLCAK